MDHLVEAGAAVHQVEGLADERLEQARGVVERLADPFLADDRVAVPGEKDLGSAAGPVVEGQHAPERVGPLQRVALDLLRVAGVGRGPDEQVPAAEHAALGEPCPGVVVGLAAGVVELAGDPADLEVEMVAVGAVRVAVLGRPLERVDRELPPVDDRVVAGGQHVAVEAGRQRLVGDDHRRRPAAGGGLLLPDRDAEDVVDVTVRVDRGVEPARRPRAQRGVHLAGDEGAPGVDEYEPVVGVDRRDVGEGGHEGDPVGDLGHLRLLPEGGRDVIAGGPGLTAPEAVRGGEHVLVVGHGSPRLDRASVPVRSVPGSQCGGSVGGDTRRSIRPTDRPAPRRARRVWSSATGP